MGGAFSSVFLDYFHSVFLPCSDARFELQRAVLTISTYLNVLSCR